MKKINRVNRGDANLTEKVIEFILTSDSKELAQLSVGRIADEFEVNICFLSRKFKKSANFLLSDYLDFVRVQRAQYLLKARPDLTVQDISIQVGIKKCQLFRNKFKKIIGVNPHRYRLILKK